MLKEERINGEYYCDFRCENVVLFMKKNDASWSDLAILSEIIMEMVWWTVLPIIANYYCQSISQLIIANLYLLAARLGLQIRSESDGKIRSELIASPTSGDTCPHEKQGADLVNLHQSPNDFHFSDHVSKWIFSSDFILQKSPPGSLKSTFATQNFVVGVWLQGQCLHRMFLWVVGSLRTLPRSWCAPPVPPMEGWLDSALKLHYEFVEPDGLA